MTDGWSPIILRNAAHEWLAREKVEQIEHKTTATTRHATGDETRAEMAKNATEKVVTVDAGRHAAKEKTMRVEAARIEVERLLAGQAKEDASALAASPSATSASAASPLAASALATSALATTSAFYWSATSALAASALAASASAASALPTSAWAGSVLATFMLATSVWATSTLAASEYRNVGCHTTRNALLARLYRTRCWYWKRDFWQRQMRLVG